MKTKIIGLTGGIGSGKSTVASIFESYGIPIYIADDQSKKILNLQSTIDKVVHVFNNDVVENGIINRKKLAKIVFSNPDKLAMLNNILHPLVKLDFEQWLASVSNVPFIVKESAILFESGNYKDCFKIITVSAPLELRIERVISRDKITRQEVLLRIDQQISDEERELKSDFVLHNIDPTASKRLVSEIISSILSSL